MLSEFVDMVHETAKNVMNGMHTAFPGEIVSFDPSTCRATIMPKMFFRIPSGGTLPYPNVSGVPVVIPQSAAQGTTIAFPIKPGDGCLVIVAEQSLDYWMYGINRDGNEGSDLGFDLTNAICIPGLFVTPNAALAKACAENAVVIQSPKVIVDGDLHVDGDLTVSGSYPYYDPN